MSDHADWNGLLEAIAATGARRIICTHGYTDLFSKYLIEMGYEALAETTDYVGEEAEEEEKA